MELPSSAAGVATMSCYDTLGKAAAHRRVKLRQHREAVLRHLGAGMSLQEQLAWDLLERLCPLDPAALLFGQLRVGAERWWSLPTCRPLDVAFVRVPVPRNWSPLWVVYAAGELLLSKYDSLDSFWSRPLEDPRLFDALGKALAHLGFPVRFDD
jgi:hypothetical protein